MYALVAVALPVLIHFLNLQRPRKVAFPNVRFLRELQQTTSNRLKLKHWLILLTRVLFIIFLVLAFAQPFLGSTDQQKNGNTLVQAFVDNSFSMMQEGEEGKSFDQSLSAALKLSEAYPGTTKFELITQDFEGKDALQRSKENFSERLSELKYSGSSRAWNEVFSRSSSRLQQTSADQKHVYLFSDFQKGKTSLDKLPLDSATTYFWVPMQSKEIQNVYIDSAWLSSPVVRENENVELNCKIFNSGNNEVNDFPVKFYVEGIQVSSQNVSISANASVLVTFTFVVQGKGDKRAEIRIDDQPVSFDNQYFLTFRVSPVIRILHLYEKDPVLARVYGGEPLFRLTSRPVGDFNYAQIDQSDLVVLEGIRSIPESLIQPLFRFAQQGGNVVLVPSYNGSQESYGNFLNVFGVSGVQGFSSVDTSQRVAAQLAVIPFEHPFYSDFFIKNDGRLQMPFAFKAFTCLPKGEALMKYRDGSLFMSRISSGNGMMYMFMGGLQMPYTDFANHSLLVPVFYKIAFLSVGQMGQLAYSFQQAQASLKLDFPPKSNVSLVQGKTRIIPAQRYVQGKLILELSQENLSPGFYELYHEDSLLTVLAFNYGKSESSMNFYKEEELKVIAANYPNVRLLDPGSSETFLSTVKAAGLGIPLWRYCILACLVFLLAETLLIRYFRTKLPSSTEVQKEYFSQE